MEELKPIYDSAMSFYKKAHVIRTSNKLILRSYKTDILSFNINDYTLYFSCKDISNKKIYSHTTLRHLKEFLKQYDYILELYDMNKDKVTKNDIKQLIEKSKLTYEA